MVAVGDVGVIIVISFSPGFLQAIVRWERPSFIYFAHFQRPNCRAWWLLVTLLLSLSFAKLQGTMRWDVSSATFFDEFQRPNCRLWCDEMYQGLLIFIGSSDQTAGYSGRWCVFCCFCCCDFWWMFQGLGKLLNFKIIFEECFRFWDLLLATTRIGPSWLYLGESSVLGESEHIT